MLCTLHLCAKDLANKYWFDKGSLIKCHILVFDIWTDGVCEILSTWFHSSSVCDTYNFIWISIYRYEACLLHLLLSQRGWHFNVNLVHTPFLCIVRTRASYDTLVVLNWGVYVVAGLAIVFTPSIVWYIILKECSILPTLFFLLLFL